MFLVDAAAFFAYNSDLLLIIGPKYQRYLPTLFAATIGADPNDQLTMLYVDGILICSKHVTEEFY